MSYRNKTYVIFDGENDMWAYAYLKGWKSNENMNFNFYDAHDIRPLSDRASEETVKTALRQRFSNAKQVVVLVGDNTKTCIDSFVGRSKSHKNWTCRSSL